MEEKNNKRKRGKIKLEIKTVEKTKKKGKRQNKETFIFRKEEKKRKK